MPITHRPAENLFHLASPRTSWVLRIHPSGFPLHQYWGPRLREESLPSACLLADEGWRAFSVGTAGAAGTTGTGTVKEPGLDLSAAWREYPGYGNGDFREPAIEAEDAEGGTVCDLRYVSHRIFAGKPALAGLPAVYVEADAEADSLEITLEDAFSGLRVLLLYTVFRDHDALCRSVKVVNAGKKPLRLRRVMSASVDLPAEDFSLLHLQGSWARERQVEKRPLPHGGLSIESRRGTSSHQHNPFFALLEPGADEEQGRVFGFSLVYSGNFRAACEGGQYGTVRALLGINPFGFSWKLDPGEAFQAPEAVLVHSEEGLGGLSRAYHRLYRTRLCRGPWRDAERPVLVNNWEATYFDFTAEKIEALARESAPLGIELLVLDDGWFGKRDTDRTSLGDWFEDRRKLPGGLKDLAERVNREGLRFGLWFEPEMISPDSELYRAHPDWCLHVGDRPRSTSRHQLVLDYSRQDVTDHIVERLRAILASAPIAYVKWDMNRYLTEAGSALLPADRQGETAHRFLLGVYRVMEEVTRAFPQVLFEGCSGGGGRFDPGILHYMPQIWTSDNSDAVERLKIQWGTSLVYPLSSMGAHVSAVPNHQVHRITPMELRGQVALFGSFGYELDFAGLPEEDKARVKGQIELYRRHRKLLHGGDFYRILSPFEGQETAWMVVSPDRREALLGYYKVLGQAQAPQRLLRLRGLDPSFAYRLDGKVYGGDVLVFGGFKAPYLPGDFVGRVWHLEAVPA